MNGELEIFKTDRRGRVRVPFERREALMEEFEKSGLSGAEFARLAGIKYATFANWRQNRRKVCGHGERLAQPGSVAGSAIGEGPVRILEAVVEERDAARRLTGQPVGLLIELPGGGRMEVQSSAQARLAAELLEYLAQSRRRPC
jgi:transposase-like protein